MLSDIQQRLEQDAHDGLLQFSAEHAELLGLTKVLSKYSLRSDFSIAVQSLQPIDGGLHLSGRAEFFETTSDAIDIYITEQSGAPVSTVIVGCERAWRISELFPSLPPQKKFQDGRFGECENYLTEFVADSCTVAITSAATQIGERTIVEGVSVWGKVKVGDQLADHLPWLADLPSVDYDTVIAQADERVSIRVMLPVAMPEVLSDLGFNDMQLAIDSHGAGGPSGFEATAECSWTWSVGLQQIDFNATLVLTSADTRLTAVAAYRGDGLHSLVDAVSALGIPVDLDALPVENILPDVRPELISVTVDLSTLTVTNLTIHFSLISPWRLVPNTVEIAECTLAVMVTEPFGNGRSLGIAVHGESTFGELPVRVSYQSFSRALTFHRSEPVDAQSLLAPYLAAPLPFELPLVNSLSASVDPVEPRVSLKAELGSGFNMPVGEYSVQLAFANLYLDITPKQPRDSAIRLHSAVEFCDELATLTLDISAQSEFVFALSRLSLTRFFKEVLAVDVPDWLGIDFEQVLIRCTSAGDVTVSSVLNIGASALLEQATSALPISLTGLSINSARLQYVHASRTWSLTLAGEHPDERAPDDNSVAVRSFSLTYSGGGTAPSSLRVDLAADGRFCIADGTEISFSGLHLIWDGGDGSWTISGTAAGSFLNHSIELDVTGEATQHETTWKFSLAESKQLAEWDDICTITLRKLAFDVRRRDEKITFGVAGDIRAVVQDVVDIDFDVLGKYSKDQFQIRIDAKLPEIKQTIPLVPLPPAQPALELTMSQLGLDYDGTKGMRVSGQGSTSVSGVPDTLKDYFPPEASGRLEIGQGGFSIRGELNQSIDFPALKLSLASGVEIDLSTPSITLQAMHFEIYKDAVSKQRKVELGAELDIAASGFNNLFGRDARGKPKVEFMNPRFGLAVVLGQKPKLRLLSSPFTDMTARLIDRRLQTIWKFGDYGELQLQFPELSLEAGRVEASAGFEITRPLKLPFFAIKWLLHQMGVPEAVTDIWPNAIPLEGVNLEQASLLDVLGAMIGTKQVEVLDSQCSGAISFISNEVDDFKAALPARMTPYLNFEVPKRLNFEVAVGGGGSTSVNIVADPDSPIRLLLPNASPLPEIVGISLRKFGLGQFLGGSLFSLELDADIDRFDLASIAVGIPLGSAKSLENHYTFRDVVAVGPTAVPIPIPFLFSEIAWTYRDIFGIRLGTRWIYRHETDFLGILVLAEALKSFFLDRDFLLHDPKNKNEHIDWHLDAGPNYLSTPDALGSATLGDEHFVLGIDLYESVARVLDALKTGNAGYVIEAIPLRHEDRWIRIGQANLLELGPLEVSATWCVSTHREFREVLLANDETREILNDFDGERVLRAMPSGAERAFDKGFIILLGGAWELTEFLKFDCKFGMAMSGAGRFGLGLLIEGAILDVLSVSFHGDLNIDAGASRYSLKGHQNLSLFNQTVLDAVAEVLFEQDHLQVELALACGPIQIANPKLILGSLPSGATGMAIVLTWFDGASRQFFELGYKDQQLAFMTDLTVIKSSIISIEGRGSLSVGLKGVAFEIAASIDVVGFIQGSGDVSIQNGRFEFGFEASVGDMRCLVDAKAEIGRLLDTNFGLSVAFQADAINAVLASVTDSIEGGLQEAQKEVDTMRRLAEERERQLEGKILKWEDFRKVFNIGCDKAESIARDRIKELPWIVRRAASPFVAPFFSAMAEVRKRIDKDWEKYTWEDLNRFLDLALTTSKIDITYPTLWPPPFLAHYRKDLLTETQRTYLTKAKGIIENLRGPINIAINAKQAADVALTAAGQGLNRAKSLTNIKIHSIGMEAQVGDFTKPGLKCTVDVTVLGDRKPRRITFVPSAEALGQAIYSAVRPN